MLAAELHFSFAGCQARGQDRERSRLRMRSWGCLFRACEDFQGTPSALSRRSRISAPVPLPSGCQRSQRAGRDCRGAFTSGVRVWDLKRALFRPAQSVVGLDFSHAFIRAANRLKARARRVAHVTLGSGQSPPCAAMRRVASLAPCKSAQSTSHSAAAPSTRSSHAPRNSRLSACPLRARSAPPHSRRARTPPFSDPSHDATPHGSASSPPTTTSPRTASASPSRSRRRATSRASSSRPSPTGSTPRASASCARAMLDRRMCPWPPPSTQCAHPARPRRRRQGDACNLPQAGEGGFGPFDAILASNLLCRCALHLRALSAHSGPSLPGAAGPPHSPGRHAPRGSEQAAAGALTAVFLSPFPPPNGAASPSRPSS